MPLYKRVNDIVKMDKRRGVSLADSIGINPHTFRGYLKEARQHKITPEILEKILQVHPEISREWLFFDEGEMLSVGSCPERETNQKSDDLDGVKLRIANLEHAISGALPTSALRPIPLIGFAACGTEGWGGTMTYEVPITPPHPRPDMIAIVASGDSMLPEGIGNGHICFCDPHAPPMPGECVYIEQTDGKAALKRFLGECHIKGSGAGIELRYWRRKDGKLIEHNLQLANFFLKTIAPVIYVQRRV